MSAMPAVTLPIAEPVNVPKGHMVIEEYLKLVSLMIVPDEQMRRALRFYKRPEIDTSKVPHFGPMLRMLKHFECQQDLGELDQVMNLLRGKKSLLEIGSCFGGSLKRLATVLAPQSLIVSIDMPMANPENELDRFRESLHPLDSLKEACHHINLTMGHRVELFMGNSRDQSIVQEVAGYAPFDLGFIDGDHSYEGVKADWENYGPLCKVVAFHDIAGGVEGCVRFWNELVKEGKYRTQEFINSYNGYSGLGIGVVFREESSPS